MSDWRGWRGLVQAFYSFRRGKCLVWEFVWVSMQHPNFGALPRNPTEAKGGTVVRVDGWGRQASGRAGRHCYGPKFRTQEHNHTLVEVDLWRLRRLIGACQGAWRNSPNHFLLSSLQPSLWAWKRRWTGQRMSSLLETLKLLPFEIPGIISH